MSPLAAVTLNPLILTLSLATTPGVPQSPLEKPSALPADAIPGVDLSALDAAQKARVTTILKDEHCPCGCGMNLFQCRHEDQTCPVSPPLAQTVADGVREGRTDDQIRTSLRTDSVSHAFTIDSAPMRGARDARVTIVEFGDFQDSATALADSFIKEILATWPKDVRVVFKNLPADRHPPARFAAEAAMAGHAQSRFWDLHDRMLADFRAINPDTVRGWAKDAGLDLVAWDKALASPEIKATVDADIAEARKALAAETPTFFINGRLYRGVTNLSSVKPVIEQELKVAKSPRPDGSVKAPAATKSVPKSQPR